MTPRTDNDSTLHARVERLEHQMLVLVGLVATVLLIIGTTRTLFTEKPGGDARPHDMFTMLTSDFVPTFIKVAYGFLLVATAGAIVITVLAWDRNGSRMLLRVGRGLLVVMVLGAVATLLITLISTRDGVGAEAGSGGWFYLAGVIAYATLVAGSLAEAWVDPRSY
ncbi:hypothetical protein [Nocardioides sp. AE5]|uniref:hypothetical protein n=1 Tax=Nocardioides sp. AE5 TaxID=2962573 RepID=UPI002882CEA4|nr:hypothetical protein [Nocardioides sp. AE5]MDT0202035.1 hypothetical protein [Nocardioides sp. AE5]